MDFPCCLYVFDFYETIIEEDPDHDLCDLMPIPDEILPTLFKKGWASYMNQVLEYLLLRGVSLEVIKNRLRRQMLVPGMNSLLNTLTMHCRRGKLSNKSQWIVISDSNEYFIKWTLSHRNPPIEPNQIISNPAMVRPNGRIQINPLFQKQSCSFCLGICKGHALLGYLEASGGRERFDKIIYVGQSSKDLCILQILQDNDIFYARKGFAIERLLERGFYKGRAIRFRAQIKFFKNASEIRLEHSRVLENTV